MHKNKFGMTVFDLIVSVSIITFLSSIISPIFESFKVKARATEGKIILTNIYKMQEIWSSEYEVYSSCLNQMGLKSSKEGYFSYGFTDNASNNGDINSPNGKAVQNGAPDPCLNNTQQNTHFFIGAKAVGSNSAPTMAETLVNLGPHEVSQDGYSYMVTAYGHIGKNIFSDDSPFDSNSTNIFQNANADEKQPYDFPSQIYTIIVFGGEQRVVHTQLDPPQNNRSLTKNQAKKNLLSQHRKQVESLKRKLSGRRYTGK